MTAHTVVRDEVIWTKHIHGDDVQRAIASLSGGEDIRLIVDNVPGTWRKMSDGKDGRPTPGIKPADRARAFWRELYLSKRNQVVEIRLDGETPTGNSLPAPEGAPPSFDLRAAARAALMRGLSGYRSDGRKVSRDEMHDRDLDRQP